MKRLATLLACAAFLAGAGARAQTLDVDGGTPVVLIGPQAFGDVIVENGATLILNDVQLFVDGGLTVRLGGTITQDAGNALTTVQAPNGTVDVQTGGQILLTGTGLLGGSQPGNAFGCSGQAIDPTSKLVVAGAANSGGSSGGSFGGTGGGPHSNAVYGSQSDILYPGSGGACGNPPGANGGGAIKIVAKAVQVDGVIRVDGNGGTGCCSSSGGSGGSIYVSTPTFGGAGTLTANGGAAGGGGSSGGGGRIQVSYGASSFAGTFEAAAGGADSTVGTVNVSDQAANPNLVVQDGVYHLSTGAAVNSVTLLGGSVLSIDGSVTITQPLVIPTGATVILNSVSALTGLTLPSHVDGTLVFNVAGLTWAGTNSTTGNVWVKANTTIGSLEVMSGGFLTADATVTFTGNLNVDSSGTVTHSVAVSAMSLDVMGTMLVSTGGAVDVTGKGLWGGSNGSPFGCFGATLDPILHTVISGAAQAVGGTYGGIGGGAGVAAVYGTETDMQYLGSGGGCGNPPGANGGGLIRINTPTLQVDGVLRADGAAASGCCSAAGGSGGGVFVSATTFKGSGVLSATGGAGSGGGGAGGGGRIFATYTQSTFTGALRALPGAAGAGFGSSFTTDMASSANLIVSGGYYHLLTGQALNSVSLGPDGILYADGTGTITQPLAIPSSTSVWLDDVSQTQNLLLPAEVDGMLALNAPGIVWPGSHVTTGNIWVTAAGTMGPLEVRAGGSLTVDDRITVDGGVVIDSNGTLTHSPGVATLDLEVGGPFQLLSGGNVSLGGRGLLGGSQPGNPFGCSGEALDPVSHNLISGAGQASGGSFGGQGGGATTNAVYGSQKDVLYLGAGGGCGNPPGANGGGRFKLVAASVQIDGTLVADGNSGTGCCSSSGGAGGSVYISTPTLTGGGVVSANGGAAGNGGNAGGGGRIEITYDQSSFAGTVRANAGGAGAASGSVFLNNATANPDIVIEFGVYHMGAGDSANSVTLLPGATLDLDGPANIAMPLVIPASTTVSLNSVLALQSVSLPSEVDGTLILNAAGLSWSNSQILTGTLWVKAPGAIGALEIQSGGTLIDDATMTTSGSVQFDSGALFTHSPTVNGNDLRVGGTLTFNQGSSANATGKGMLGGNQAGNPFSCSGETVNVSNKLPAAGSATGAGGSFGGLGAGTGPNALYGSATDVQYLGSGGGCGGGPTGGNGGGLLRMTSSTMIVNGSIVADGQSVQACCGWAAGGSGGGIYVLTNVLEGSGTFSASGGAGGPVGADGNGGGAGRIEVLAGTNTFTGNYLTLGGVGATAGATGTSTVTASAGVIPSIVTSPNTVAIIGQAYSYDSAGFPIAVGSAPITWSLDAAPMGATADPNSGAITWTPSSAGSPVFILRATNSAGFTTQSWTVTVAGPPKIVSTASGSAVVAQPYNYDASDTVSVTGTPPFSFAVSGAPPGNPPFSVDPSGRVNWIPSVAGTFNPCIIASNAVGTDTQCFSVTATATLGTPPQIVSSCNTVSVVGVPYQYDDVGKAQATGGQPITWSLTTPPAGMTIAVDGTLAWTPTASGSVTFSIVATNSAGSDTQSCTVAVRTANQAGAPVIVRAANPVAAVGVPYVYSADHKIQALGTPPITFASVSGPPGLVVDPNTGYVGWIPQTTGMTSVTVSAMNSAGSDTYAFTVDVTNMPGLPPVASITGGPFTGAGPLPVPFDGSGSFSAAGILGWSWDFGDGSPLASGAMVSHTYQSCGGYIARLIVTDVFGQTGTAFQAVDVSCGGLKPPTARIVLSSAVGSGSLLANFGCDCTAGSSPIVGYQWQSTDGFFSDQSSDSHTFGPGTNTLQLVVVDGNGLSGIDRVTISVANAMGVQPPFATAEATPTFATPPATIQYSADYGDVDGTIASHTWTFADGSSVTTVNPTKMYATATREHAVFSVTDNNGLTASSFVDVVIATSSGGQPPQFISIPRTSIFAGEAYTYNKDNLPVVRGTGPFSFKLDTAPQGASADPGTGAITWTPPAGTSGDAGFSLEVDGAAGSATQTWAVDVVPLAGNTSTPPKKGCGCGAGTDGLFALALAPLLLAMRRRRKRG